jgi:hypothetical protein
MVVDTTQKRPFSDWTLTSSASVTGRGGCVPSHSHQGGEGENMYIVKLCCYANYQRMFLLAVRRDPGMAGTEDSIAAKMIE